MENDHQPWTGVEVATLSIGLDASQGTLCQRAEIVTPIDEQHH